MTDPRILDVDQVAELLHCDRDTVAEALKAGTLPGLKFGRGWIVPAEALFERLNELAHEEAEHRRSRSAVARTSVLPTARPSRRRAPPDLGAYLQPRGHGAA